jgi:NMT1/THI5 like
MATSPCSIGSRPESFAYVGIKEGFFAAEGLDVAIDIGRGGSDTVAKVATGADVGGAALNPLMSAAAESNISIKACHVGLYQAARRDLHGAGRSHYLDQIAGWAFACHRDLLRFECSVADDRQSEWARSVLGQFPQSRQQCTWPDARDRQGRRHHHLGHLGARGYLILQKSFNFDMAGTFAVLIVLSLIGVGVHAIISALQRRIVFWIDIAGERGAGA